ARRRPPPSTGGAVAGRHGPGAGWRLSGERHQTRRDGRGTRLFLYRLDGGDGRRVRPISPCHTRTGTVDATAPADVARDRSALGGGASVLSVARSRGSPPDGSGVGGGGRGPERHRLPVGERLGARARQRGRSDRQPQAGRILPARAL